MDPNICQVNLIHEDLVVAAREQMPPLETVDQLASVYKLLGEPSRLKILLALRACEMCVCDLAAMMTSTPSAISHQLKLLRITGLLKSRKHGKMVYYSLEENAVQRILLEGLNYMDKKK